MILWDSNPKLRGQSIKKPIFSTILLCKSNFIFCQQHFLLLLYFSTSYNGDYLHQMLKKVELSLQILQMCLFLLARVLDDLTWYEFHLNHQVEIFDGIGIGCMLICVLLQVIRKRNVEGVFRILFVRSQMKFVISWSLVVTIVVLFFNIFGCHHQPAPEGEGSIDISYGACCINTTLIMLSNFNNSLICNTKADKPELILYETILFAEVIYNAHLILIFIDNLEGQAKDQSILLVSLIIANQVLIMDLIFRAAYEDRERQEEREERLLHGHYHIRAHDHTEKEIELTPH